MPCVLASHRDAILSLDLPTGGAPSATTGSSLRCLRLQNVIVCDRDMSSNGAEIRDTSVERRDASGMLDGRWTGVTLMASKSNFRPCWRHARDYGLMELNPFGQKAFTSGEASRVVVKKGESLTLRVGIVIRKTADEAGYQPQKACQQFIDSEELFKIARVDRGVTRKPASR